MLAVHHSIPSRLLDSPSDIEAVAIKLHNLNCIVCVVYVPPSISSSTFHSVLLFLKNLASSGPTVLVGDFNLPDINWSSLSSHSALSDDFCEFVFDCNLSQLVEEPTHIKGNCLDLILTNIPANIGPIQVQKTSIVQSDHFMLSFTLSAICSHPRKVPTLTKYVPDLSKLNYSDLCSHFMSVDFSDCFLSTDAEFIWYRLRSIILEAVELHAPKVKLRPRMNSPCWWNADVRHQLHKVKTLRKKSSKSAATQTKLKLEEKCLLDKMSDAKCSYESRLVEDYAFKRNSKIYKYIKRIMKSDHLPKVMHFNDKSALSDSDKAHLFNVFFESVYSKPLPNITRNHANPMQSTLDLINITDLDVLNILSSLDPSKASGIDGIGPRLLRTCADGLYRVFHHLFTMCLWYCQIPCEWKLHCIVPVFKSGDKSSIKNYRPISLLCCISKVLERLIYNKLFHFISNSISPFQFGFLKNHSCLQQLLVFLHNVMDALTEKNVSQVDSIYLDFRKAFDSVPHTDLLYKLRCIGITGRIFDWLKCYLSNRNQLVSVNGSHSSVLPVSSGVPQGSILGPLLFLVYINDLPDVITSSKVFIFADDTKCCQPIKSVSNCDELQDSLNEMSTWSEMWDLHYNESKCVLMNFQKPNKSSAISYDYTINNNIISVRDCHKDLGVLLQSNLSWTKQYSLICSKAYKTLGLLRRSFSSSNSLATRRQLYISLVRSQMSYCSLLWRPTLIKDIKKLESVQRRSTKFVIGHEYAGLNYKDRLNHLKLLPLMYRFELADIMFLVTSLKHPTERFNILQFIKLQDLNTRSSDRVSLKHVRCESNFQQHFYFNRITHLWNRLPAIDLSLSVKTIRTKIYEVLWSNFIENFSGDYICSFHFICPCNKCHIK